MDLKSLLSSKIKEFRKRRGLTQAGLAEAMRCSHSTIRDYENLVSFPGPEMIQSLAIALNVHPSEFFKESKEKREDYSIELIRQIASLGPTELEILRDTLETLSRPLRKKQASKEG